MDTLMDASRIQSMPAATHRYGLFGITTSAAVASSAPTRK